VTAITMTERHPTDTDQPETIPYLLLAGEDDTDSAAHEQHIVRGID
jgi:hypothetical protein